MIGGGLLTHGELGVDTVAILGNIRDADVGATACNACGVSRKLTGQLISEDEFVQRRVRLMRLGLHRILICLLYTSFKPDAGHLAGEDVLRAGTQAGLDPLAFRYEAGTLSLIHI